MARQLNEIKEKLQGTFTAMVTPFSKEGQVDWERLGANAAFQIKHGISGLVPCGTTGESPTLTHEEHRKVIQTVTEAAADSDQTLVIAGTGSNATAEALTLTRHAMDIGVDAALSVNPYYNKPTQEGLYQHFMKIADVGLPIVLYNIPGRTGIALTPQTIARLAEHPNIIAVKEATGSLDTASEIARLCDLILLSGDDSLTLPLMSIGAKGVISVLSNLLPHRVSALTGACLAEDFKTARQLHLQLFDLFKGMFIATNPIPIKTAMAWAGMDTGTLRLPMCPMDDAECQKLKTLLFNHPLSGLTASGVLA